MFAFSSNESAVLQRKTDVTEGILPTNLNDIKYYYELERCMEWAKKNSLSKVLLSISAIIFFRCVVLLAPIDQRG
jgi:hypothetical protein